MVKFTEYQKPISPRGTSLFLIYVLYTGLSITYAYNQEFGKKVPKSDNAIFATLIAISFPLIFWPLTNDQEFANEYLPNILKPGIENNFLVNFLKKFFAGYYIAIMFPFLKLQSYIWGNKTELSKYKSKEYFNYYVAPFIGFIILFSAIGIAVYFNENVINATNSVGIFYMNPSQRSIYQIIFSLLLFTIFFSLIPYKMAEALDKTWNYYLMFFFSVINLIIINNQLNSSDVYRKNVLTAVYIITIIMLLYSVYNLVYLSSDSKDYRILTMGKLTDEDRLNINPNLAGIYNAIKTIKDDKKEYFDGLYFNADKAKDFNIDESVKISLNGNTINSFNTMLKSIDQNFIDIYQARMSWEKSLKLFFKAKDSDRKEIIDGFFESSDFAKITNTPVESLSKAAKDFRQAWIKSRAKNQLPDSDTSQKVFGVAITTIGGNIVLGTASATLLNDISLEVDEKITVLFNRYMFIKLAEGFVNVTKLMENFKIYKVETSYETSSLLNPSFSSSQSQDITTLNNIKEFYKNFNVLLYDLVDARIRIQQRNQKVTVSNNLNIFQKALNTFNNIYSFDKNDIDFDIILVYYSNLRYRISVLIAIYDENISDENIINDKNKNIIINTYENLINKLYDISKKCLQIIFNNKQNENLTRAKKIYLSQQNYSQTLKGGNIENSPANDIINHGSLDITTNDTPSYKIIKPITKNEDWDNEDNMIENLENNLTKQEENYTLPEMVFDNKLLNPENDLFYNNITFSNAYENILIVYNQLIMSFYTLINNNTVANNNGIESLLTTINARNNNNDITNLQTIDNNIKTQISNGNGVAAGTAELINNLNNNNPVFPLPDGGLLNRFNVFTNTPETNQRDNFLIDYSQLENLFDEFNKEYNTRKGISNIIPSFLQNNQAIKEDVKFFSNVSPFPPSNLTINDMKEQVFYQFESTTSSDKLNVNKTTIDNFQEFIRTVNIKKNSIYESLTEKQLNTIAKDKRFQEIFKYYFPTVGVKNGNDVKTLYEKFKEIYTYYIRAMSDYLLTSNKTSRNITTDSTLKLKKEIELINKGFPKIIIEDGEGNNNLLFSKGSLYTDIGFGKLEAGNYEEDYNNLMLSNAQNVSATYKTIENTNKMKEIIRKEINSINNEKRIIFTNIVISLLKGKDENITFEGKTILKINFPKKKSEIGLSENITDKLSGQVYNIFTKLMLRIINYIDNNIDFTNYKLRQGNIYSAVPFLTVLLSNYYMFTFSNTQNTGILRSNANGIDTEAYEKLLNVCGIPANQRIGNDMSANKMLSDNNVNVANNLEASNPTNDTDGSALEFLNGFDNINFDVANYKIHNENINDYLNEIQKNLNLNLSDFINDITIDNNITNPGSTKRKLMKDILSNSSKNDNIYYHILARAIKENFDDPANIELLKEDNNNNNIKYEQYLTYLKNPIDQNTLINILETDFNRMISDDNNKNYPLQTLIDTVINNPIINSLKIISGV